MVGPVEVGLGATAAFEVYDPAFGRCIELSAPVERLWTGGRWIEGPAWQKQQQRLIWSDIPNNRMLAWYAADGRVEKFRAPSNGANGNTVDSQGRLITCEQYTRRVTRTEADGTITVVAGNFDGKRFTAPNDVVVKSDGSIWFTDPHYGHSPLYEGEKQLDGCHVYRVAPDGSVRQMTEDMEMPNGLAFSRDESVLYVADSGSTHRPEGPNHIRAFKVGADSELSDGKILAVDAGRHFDGFRIDLEGRLWCGVGEGIRCYLPDGRLVGRVLLPERAANLCFGGPDFSTLFACATTSVYAVRLTSAIAGSA